MHTNKKLKHAQITIKINEIWTTSRLHLGKCLPKYAKQYRLQQFTIQYTNKQNILK